MQLVEVLYERRTGAVPVLSRELAEPGNRRAAPDASAATCALTDTSARSTLEAAMRWSTGYVVAVAMGAAFTAVGGAAAQVEPGDRLGRMAVVRGTVATADHKLFDTCDPVILTSGRYERRCGVVPHVNRLFIGYGLFAPTRKIAQVWAGTTWKAWFDGHPLALSAFGSSDRTLYAFPPAGGKNVTLREWRVMLVGATRGRHAIRYRAHDASGTIDATWRFTVAAR